MIADKTFGFAILGTGLISKFHARAIRDVDGANLVGVCSRDVGRAKAFAEEFDCAAFDCLDEMLAQPAVDILVIATPSGMHMEAALAAARAGKHVLCEKPLDVTLARVNAMIDAHRAAGTRLGCTFQIRYSPALQPIRDAIREGRFGTVTYAGAYIPWWRSNEYYTQSSWHGTQELDGGGALMNQGIHMIDLLCDLMPPVDEVTGFVSSLGHPGIQTEDAAAASLRFKGGAIGVVYGSTSSWPGQAKRLEITGTQGTAVFLDDALSVFEFSEKRPGDDVVVARFGSGGSAYGSRDPGAMTHALHAACFRDFIHSVRAGVPFRIDGESARRPVALIRAIYESAISGNKVRL